MAKMNQPGATRLNRCEPTCLAHALYTTTYTQILFHFNEKLVLLQYLM